MADRYASAKRGIKIVLVGHSHSKAIAEAVAASPDPALGNIATCSFEHVYLRQEPYYGMLRGAQSLMTDCGRAVRERLATADAAVLSLEGGWHDIGMVERARRFDFFGEAGEASPIQGRELIPRRLMTQYLSQRMESPSKEADGSLRSSFAEALPFICEHLACPAVLVEAPPPVPDAKKVARYRPVAASEGNGVAPLAIRLKLWRLQCSLVRQYCDRAQIDYLPVPAEVLDADGVLDARAYAGVDDCTHVNAWYGRFVLRQIDAWLGRCKVTARLP